MEAVGVYSKDFSSSLMSQITVLIRRDLTSFVYHFDCIVEKPLEGLRQEAGKPGRGLQQRSNKTQW